MRAFQLLHSEQELSKFVIIYHLESSKEYIIDNPLFLTEALVDIAIVIPFLSSY